MSAPSPDTLIYEKGETIFEEGTTGESAFIIVSGEVVIYKANRRGQAIQVGRLGGNELIGEICLFQNNAVRMASVVAFTDRVELLELKKDDFDSELTLLSPVMQRVIKALIQRLKQTYTQIAFLS